MSRCTCHPAALSIVSCEDRYGSIRSAMSLDSADRSESYHGMDTAQFRCKTRVEVQFRDIDALGHVNNAVYFSYFEMARMAYLRAVSGQPVRLSDLRIVLVEAACRYRSPALLGEMLEIGIRVSHLRRGSFAFEYCVCGVEDSRLVAVG